MNIMNPPIVEFALDRRAHERRARNRGAVLCIPGLKRLFSLALRNASQRGVGIRLHSSVRLLPVEFLIAEEGFWTVRRCRLAWRDGDFAGAEFID